MLKQIQHTVRSVLRFGSTTAKFWIRDYRAQSVKKSVKREKEEAEKTATEEEMIVETTTEEETTVSKSQKLLRQ